MVARCAFVISGAQLVAHHRRGPELLDCRVIFSVPGPVEDLIAGAGV